MIYKYSSQYSEDEVSDLSLDELTDEEPEDLRATLNKNKHLIRVNRLLILPQFSLFSRYQSPILLQLQRKAQISQVASSEKLIIQFLLKKFHHQ